LVTDRDLACVAALVAPVPADTFLTTYWRAQPVLCPGPPSRAATLLSWDDLNGILEHHWRETYRFRLACRGRDLAPDSYADVAANPPRIRAHEIVAHLRRGATLSFDAIDELHAPLTALADAFECVFRNPTQINVYAAWRSIHGLGVHQDDEQVFIVQIDGRKRWRLYGELVAASGRPVTDGDVVPSSKAVFDEILRPGDVLYIPRGCYHDAVPLDEPTLHLTIGIACPEDGATFTPRPSFSLPWSATGDGLPPGTDFSVRLTMPATDLDSDPGSPTTEWRFGSRPYRFPRAMQRIVAHLRWRQPVAFEQVAAALAEHYDQETVRFFVGMLASYNLVAIRTAVARG
jgi:hypothetical protein